MTPPNLPPLAVLLLLVFPGVSGWAVAAPIASESLVFNALSDVETVDVTLSPILLTEPRLFFRVSAAE